MKKVSEYIKSRRLLEDDFSFKLKKVLLEEAQDLQAETKGKYKPSKNLKRLLKC